LSGQTSSAAYGNTAVGYQALNGTMTSAGVQNTALGYQAGNAVTSSYGNVFVGYQAASGTAGGTSSSTAIGSGTVIGNSIFSATAIGAGATASANYALAIGQGAVASAQSGTAIGRSASAGGQNSLALGTFAYTSGANSIVIDSQGAAFYSSSPNSIMIGGGHNMSGTNNLILGYQVGSTTVTTGSNNILIGTSATTDTAGAADTNSIAIGGVGIGTNTVELGNSSTVTTELFGKVGIGTATIGTNVNLAVNGGAAIGTYANTGVTGLSNGLIVSGNVAIGTSTTSSALSVTGLVSNTYSGISPVVTGAVSSGGVGFQINNTSGGNYIFESTGSSTTPASSFAIYNVGSSATIDYFTPSGALYAGTGALSGIALSLQNSVETCTLTPAAAAVFSCSSDARLKRDIVESSVNALDYLGKIQIKDYTLKSDGSHNTGVIAQDMQKIHPELVTESSDKMLAVRQVNPWLLVKAIQEQQKEIEQLHPDAFPFHKCFFDLLVCSN
jgi:hypothetical protein